MFMITSYQVFGNVTVKHVYLTLKAVK